MQPAGILDKHADIRAVVLEELKLVGQVVANGVPRGHCRR